MKESRFGYAKKYLVCSYDAPEGKDSPEYLEKEEFNDFAAAVAQYLFRCATRDDVILANLDEETIIRQYAHAGEYEESDALYIA